MMNTVISRTQLPLAPQQKQILILIAKGYSNEEIADFLSISRHTLYRHMEAIRHKTGIKSRVLLAFYTLSEGIVTQEDIKAAIQRERKQR
jgi:DNA-binding CsgD family transcriptional regulator